MHIAGFNKVTLSDFPGRVAAMVFSQGCNFRCPFCHNGSLLAPASFTSKLIAVEEVLSYLQRRCGKISGLVISGGEPCLQQGLIPFCRQLKELGMAIKIDSNGSRPHVLAQLIADQLVDFIAMDIKAPLATYAKLAGRPVNCKAIISSIELIADCGLPHLFRTTEVTTLINEADRRAIRRLVPHGSQHIFQPFIATNALEQELCNATGS